MKYLYVGNPLVRTCFHLGAFMVGVASGLPVTGAGSYINVSAK